MCQQVVTQNCDKTPQKVCHEIPREVCRDDCGEQEEVPHQQCRNIPREVCSDLPKKVYMRPICIRWKWIIVVFLSIHCCYSHWPLHKPNRFAPLLPHWNVQKYQPRNAKQFLSKKKIVQSWFARMCRNKNVVSFQQNIVMNISKSSVRMLKSNKFHRHYNDIDY